MSPTFSSRGAIATAMRAESPEMTMPGTCMRPRQAKKATVAAVATVRDARASMRARRFDTAALPRLMAERMPSHFDVREAVMVNAFIASFFVALAGIQEPAYLRFRIRPCVYKKARPPSVATKNDAVPVREQRIFGWRPCRPDMSGACARPLYMGLDTGIKKARYVSSIDRCSAGQTYCRFL